MRHDHTCLLCLYLVAQACAPFAVAAESRTGDKERVVTNAPAEEPRRTFKQRYPNPVISEPRPTVVRGLEMVTVFDKSQLAEDPLVPVPWLKLKDGTMLELNPGSIQDALKRLRFSPRNEAEAIGAVRIYIDGGRSVRHRILRENGEPFPSPAESARYPGVDTLGIEKPVAIADGDSFRVTVFVLTEPHMERYSTAPRKT